MAGKQEDPRNRRVFDEKEADMVVKRMTERFQLIIKSVLDQCRENLLRRNDYRGVWTWEATDEFHVAYSCYATKEEFVFQKRKGDEYEKASNCIILCDKIFEDMDLMLKTLDATIFAPWFVTIDRASREVVLEMAHPFRGEDPHQGKTRRWVVLDTLP